MRSAMAASTRAGRRPQSSDSRRNPAARLVLDELPTLLQVAQRLDGEERVPARLCIERIPEPRAQAVGLGVHVRLDERAAVRPVQVDHDLAPAGGGAR